MANESKRLSAAGWSALRTREGVILRHYNDLAGNCTFGIGTLVHPGPCTSEELHRPVTTNDVNEQLAVRVQQAETAVRRQIRDRESTQEQFDALVSFTYNVGAEGARATLAAVNRGRNDEAARHISQNVWIHPRTADGRRLAPVRVPGLERRRIEEAAPFRGAGANR